MNDGVRPIDEIQLHNPLVEVPVLYDAGQCLFGTGLVVEYLYATYPHGPLHNPRLANSITRPERHRDDRLVCR